MDFKAAAFRLQMTVGLLKWFTAHPPKQYGRKLVASSTGEIDEQELLAFDAYLWDSWPTRYVPKGISDELLREARGRCGCCNGSFHVLEEAHIDRLSIERKSYCQHPHNLILLCGSCHGTYDSMPPRHLTNDVIKTCKRTLQTRLLEDVAIDFRISEAVRGAVERAKAEALAAMADPVSWWNANAATLYQFGVLGSGLAVMPVAAALEPKDAASLRQDLTFLSGSMAPSQPLTSAVLSSIADQVGETLGPAEDTDWERVAVEGECLRCCGQAMLDFIVCGECGEQDDSVHGEECYEVVEDDDSYLLNFPGHDGGLCPYQCSACGSRRFSEVEYQDWCGYCGHSAEKLKEE